MRTGAVVQARMSSTRLPGKVLLTLPYGSEITVLGQVIRRLKKSAALDVIIVATTTEAEDDQIVELGQTEGAEVFRGSLHDVLSRYYHAAKDFGLDTVVRVTSDCPCIDSTILDKIVEFQKETKVDYVSNSLKRTWPHGVDVEVFTFDALERAYHDADSPPEREHVTPYLYLSGKFTTDVVEAPGHLRRPDIRITLDTPEDYALLCAIFEFLYAQSPFFDTGSIVHLFEEKPWLLNINEKIIQKKVLNNLEEELQEALKVLEIQDLLKARDFLRDRMSEL